jgi:transcriptional regulator with XRE-family HTH domain
MTDGAVNYCRPPGALRFTPMGTEKETMGKRISQLMEAKRHTQSSLAAALGTTRATVHQWVHDVSKPTPENLLWLADELGTDAHYLVFGPVEDQYGPPNRDTGSSGRYRALSRRSRT